MVLDKKYTLKQLRGLSGLTQGELAQKVGVNEQTISDYETKPGRLYNARINTIEKILYVLSEESGIKLTMDHIFLDNTWIKSKQEEV